MNIKKAVKHLADNAEGASTGKCAAYVRRALEAGGLDLSHHPVSAKDYGPTLVGLGFSKFYEFKEASKADSSAANGAAEVREFSPSLSFSSYANWVTRWLEFKEVVAQPSPGAVQDYVAKMGDVAVIQPFKGGDPNGHIAMYGGTQWVSDFKQRDLWGGPGYRKHKPTCVIYRP